MDNVEEKEVTVEIIDSEKSAKDFLKSRRAISAMAWVLVSALVILARAVFPELEVDTFFVVDKLTDIVVVLIAGYTTQDVATALFEAIGILLFGKQNKE